MAEKTVEHLAQTDLLRGDRERKKKTHPGERAISWSRPKPRIGNASARLRQPGNH